MVAPPGQDPLETAAALDAAAGALLDVVARVHDGPDVPVPATQLRALFILERGPVNVSGLAAGLGALTSSASRLCDRLEASGLLRRDTGRDRREVTVRLTTDGRRLLERLRVRRREELGRILSGMPAQARQSLVWGLAEFSAAAGRHT
ncbi:transcriptional repressor MprA [Actinomadura rubteroloni]|uniref:Transcriptional repressor MprA n=1 Tax=Actinomadura rubteroloni TaxID=1926885 RepID=A0A2P4ULL8_9ACTN|nr:MarR family transcriptional regulator [Actinomadura rubteroloni]POM25940.1 transcriptional repressor MprA [Actinomadura rubteroloni]